MNVGILTFQNAINYGAVLQTYALKYSLEKCGVTATIINYDSKTISERYKRVKIISPSLKTMLRNFFVRILQNNSNKVFTAFRNEYLNLKETSYLAKAELADYSSQFDIIFVGSDQVWNCTLTNNDTSYFLDFVESEKRYSYAASFGIRELDEEQQNFYKSYLQNFKRISVREKHSLDILENLGLTGKHVLDPTLLLTKKEWEDIAVKPKGIKKGYILIYTIGMSQDLFDFAKKLSKSNGLDIKYINDSIRNKVDGIPIIRNSSPQEWVYLFLNADVVLTNSFHGVAFSINFGKKFWVSDSKTSFKETNSRIESILTEFNLESRHLSNATIYDIYDVKKVQNVLNNKRKESIQYIKSCLSDVK